MPISITRAARYQTLVGWGTILVALVAGCTDEQPAALAPPPESASDSAAPPIAGAVAPCTSSATRLCPGDNIQAKARAAGPGATLTLQRGVYRMQTVTALSNQTFQGDPGAVMSGARLLTAWQQSGSAWYSGGQTQEFGHGAGRCASGDACRYPEDVYRDNVLLTRVLSRSAVGPGRFYFDYGADRIYVGDNPAGHVLEAAATEYAFNGSPQGVGTGVTIRGLTIEKYANPAQSGAVGRTNMGANWVLRDNEIRFNHGAGVRGGAGVVVAHNRIHHNGQIGLLTYFARVDSNEIAHNNTAGFAVDWEAGGLKFSQTRNAVARGNWVHHNRGAGLWSDFENVNTTYDRNTVEDNEDAGIFHEVSWSARITNNTVRRNGWKDPSPSEGAGIMIMSSGGTGIDIAGNTVAGNKNGIMLIQSDRGGGSQGEFVTKNVTVHDNTVTMGAKQRTGAVRYGGNAGLWTKNNNHFERGTYQLQGADAAAFEWAAGSRTDGQWRSYSNDETGRFYR